ncbi:MAG: hypothetical protein PHN75_17860 [Syntrophales bacterium]|nr:hypothetical protein [Syntrophales bacterium]
MAQDDKWKQALSVAMSAGRRATGVEEREKVPEISCGICKNFSEVAFSSDGRGTCRILKAGSDISLVKPVYVLEGDVSFFIKFNTDGARCERFERMEIIDTDGSECADPAYRRSQRQMEKIVK